MKTSTFLAVSLLSLSSTVLAAPTPQLKNVLGSITDPSAGDNNDLTGNGNENGNGNGNDNSAGNNNGNGNVAGSGNSAGNGNTVTFPSILKGRDLDSDLTNILGSITNPSAGNNNVIEDNGNDNGDSNGDNNSAGNNNGNENTAGSGNEAGNGNTVNFKERDLAGSLSNITNTAGSITDPTAGSGNSLLGNGDGNGDGNGNGNSAGNGNGNGNTAGSNNEAGNGNTVNVSPDVSPSIDLPDVTLPDITL